MIFFQLLDRFIEMFNKNKYLQFILGCATLIPLIQWIIDTFNFMCTAVIINIDWNTLISPMITSLFLLFMYMMFLYMVKQNKEMKNANKKIKDETIIMRVFHQLYYESLSMQLRGGNKVITTQERVEEEKNKLLKKLQIIYPNLPEWKVKEKIENFLTIYIQQERL